MPVEGLNSAFNDISSVFVVSGSVVVDLLFYVPPIVRGGSVLVGQRQPSVTMQPMFSADVNMHCIKTLARALTPY